jgi:hypothetical protein
MFRVRPAFLSGRTDLAQPGDRSHELSSLPDLRTLRSLPNRISGSVARGAVHLRTDTMPGEFVSLLLSRFSARAGIATRRSFPFARIGNRALRIVRMSDRSGMPTPVRSGSRPARTVPPRRRHPIPLGRIRQSYVSLCGGHTRPGVAISPNRGLRLTDRVSDRFRPRGLRRRKKARARKPEASETHKPAGHIV